MIISQLTNRLCEWVERMNFGEIFHIHATKNSFPLMFISYLSVLELDLVVCVSHFFTPFFLLPSLLEGFPCNFSPFSCKYPFRTSKAIFHPLSHCMTKDA